MRNKVPLFFNRFDMKIKDFLLIMNDFKLNDKIKTIIALI